MYGIRSSLESSRNTSERYTKPVASISSMRLELMFQLAGLLSNSIGLEREEVSISSNSPSVSSTKELE